jgi:hypothetical protein
VFEFSKNSRLFTFVAPPTKRDPEPSAVLAVLPRTSGQPVGGSQVAIQVSRRADAVLLAYRMNRMGGDYGE